MRRLPGRNKKKARMPLFEEAEITAKGECYSSVHYCRRPWWRPAPL